MRPFLFGLVVSLFIQFHIDLCSMTPSSVELHGHIDELTGDDTKYAEALRVASEAFKDVENIFNEPGYESKTGWFKDESNDEGDVVYARDTPKGRMVTISTVLNAPTPFVMKETWEGVETLPEWNRNINFAQLVARPTSNFDIYGNNDVLIVSGREFMSARIWRQIGDSYILASRSVEVPFESKHKGKVRAHLHIGGARMRPNPEDPNTTLTDVVMLADLKGMLPRFLVNQVIGKVMIMDTVTNRQHFKDLMKKETD